MNGLVRKIGQKSSVAVIEVVVRGDALDNLFKLVSELWVPRNSRNVGLRIRQIPQLRWYKCGQVRDIDQDRSIVRNG